MNQKRYKIKRPSTENLFGPSKRRKLQVSLYRSRVQTRQRRFEKVTWPHFARLRPSIICYCIILNREVLLDKFILLDWSTEVGIPVYIRTGGLVPAWHIKLMVLMYLLRTLIIYNLTSFSPLIWKGIAWIARKEVAINKGYKVWVISNSKFIEWKRRNSIIFHNFRCR